MLFEFLENIKVSVMSLVYVDAVGQMILVMNTSRLMIQSIFSQLTND